MTVTDAKKYLMDKAVNEPGTMCMAVSAILQHVRNLESYVHLTNDFAKSMTKRSADFEYIEIKK